MWKFHNFSIIQILREINFRYSRSAKSTISTNWEALNFDFYEFLHFLKAEIYQIVLFIAHKIAKMSVWEIGSSTTATFLPFQGLWICWLSNITLQPSKSAKIHKNQNSEPLNVLKWPILHFYICKQLSKWSSKIARLQQLGYLVKNGLLKGAKIHKNQNSEPLNVLKWQILRF